MNQLTKYSVVVKPTGSDCNLDCNYCFYMHKSNLLKDKTTNRLSDECLELFVKQYLETQKDPVVEFIWQGGEPTLLGLSYFKKVIEFQNKHKSNKQKVINSFQTNGVLIDEKWCRFFLDNNFLVGLSIDGPKELHDKCRYTKSKKSVYNRLLNAVNLFHKYGVEFNVLCVVNRFNAKKPMDVYRYIRDVIRPSIIQFIPCVQHREFETVAPLFWNKSDIPLIGSPSSHPSHDDSVVTEWSIGSTEWGEFLCSVWDEWINRDFGSIFIENFEDVVAQLYGYGPQKCTSSKHCGKGLALETDGSIYSCDHFVYSEYLLGNINSSHQVEMIDSDKHLEFSKMKSHGLPTHCNRCSYLTMCWGECPKNRLLKSVEGEYGVNYLCQGYKVFFEKIHNDKLILDFKLGIR